MSRLRRSVRRTLWIVGAIFVMAMATLIGALTATTPRFLLGAETATIAAETLLSDPHAAADKFDEASRNFDAALAGLRSLPEPAQFPSLIPPFSWYIHLNKAAVYLSRAGQDSSALATAYPATQTSNDPSALLTAHTAALGKLVDEQTLTLNDLSNNLAHADDELSRVPSWILFSKRGQLANLKTRVHQLNNDFPKALAFVTKLRHTLGADDTDTHTVLILFQNDAELRPSGGFIGSYGVLTASGGAIRSFKLGTDIYKLNEKAITPPPELLTISPTLAFRDSNVGQGFLNDIGTQVASVYKQATGVQPDAMIFTDLSLLEDMLGLVGPVTLPGTTTELTHDTVDTALTTYIEKDYWDTPANQAQDTPKGIIGDLIPVLLGKLQGNATAIHGLPNLIGTAVQRKSLQFWTSDQQLAPAAAALFPADTAPTGDWLKIVNTNLGGKKSSKNVTQDVNIAEKSTKDGLERTVTITRTHHGTGVWPDDENRNYMEMYLPSTAVILQKPEGKGGESPLPDNLRLAYGIPQTVWPGEVKYGDGWIRVGFWATTSVAEQTQFVLVYRLPNSLSSAPFVYLKQAGATGEHLKAFRYDGNVTANLTLEKKWHLW